MSSSTNAFQAEIAAYHAVHKKLSAVAVPFQAPMGADAGFPDFGFTVNLPTKTVDMFVEYKASHTAQMGSVRDWRFNGRFYVPDAKDEQKAELIDLMNQTPEAVQNAKRILADLQKHFHKDVKEISSGALSIVKDKVARRVLTDNFISNTKNYVISNITSNSIGDKILSHYKNKFKKSLRPRSNANVLIMMIDKQMWVVDSHGNINDSDVTMIGNFLGVQRIPKLPSLTARLEVRIQPRGLSAPITNPKPTSIDVMASYRLTARPSSGATVI